MKTEILVALRMTAVTLVLTGLLYLLSVTGIAQVAFPRQANGSLVTHDGRTVGSELIGQGFRRAAYFEPRPSAAGAGSYDARAPSGSNLGPTTRKLRDRVATDVARLRAENPLAPAEVPIELVTTSASGLDPHLSPAATRWQVPLVAAARRVPAFAVRTLVDAVVLHGRVRQAQPVRSRLLRPGGNNGGDDADLAIGGTPSGSAISPGSCPHARRLAAASHSSRPSIGIR